MQALRALLLAGLLAITNCQNIFQNANNFLRFRERSASSVEKATVEEVEDIGEDTFWKRELGGSLPTYKLTVDNGSGTGTYYEGERVPVKADHCPHGKEFDMWKVIKGDPYINEPDKPHTYVIMPGENARIRAICKDIPQKKYELIVENGTGDGKYYEGTKVPVNADPCPKGELFEKWEAVYGNPYIDDKTSPFTYVIIPGKDSKIRAVCKDRPIEEYELIVENGSGSGTYAPGEKIPVYADICPEGEEFSRWIILDGSPILDDSNKPITVVTMPAEDARIRAVCGDKLYNLIVRNGSGDGDYPAGTDVRIEANQPAPNRVFDKWVVIEGNPDIEDVNDPETILTMPDEDVIVEATYKRLWKLTVINGKGDGRYPEGEVVDIIADDPPPRQEFLEWVVISGSPSIRNENRPTTKLTMPDEDVTVEAVYKDILYELIVDNGSGDGNYPAGKVVTIIADECPPNKEFEKWIIIRGEPIIQSPSDEVTTVIMRASDARIEAVCKDILYELTVTNGSGDGLYPAGEVVTIVADEPDRLNVFDQWQSILGNPTIRNTQSSTTTVTMPANNAHVAATYKPKLYELVVEGGTGDGDYPAGESVPIYAEPCPELPIFPPQPQVFDRWEVTRGNPIVVDTNSPDTTVIMTESDATVRAICKPKEFNLEVIKGAGSGNYPSGTVVEIAAIRPPIGEVFDKWVVLAGNPSIDNINEPITDLTMPPEDVIVEATYKPELFDLEVIKGDGDGEYPAGTVVEINADEPPAGEVFDKWVVVKGNPSIEDINDPTTDLTMPLGDVVVEATYKPDRFTLTVENGSGSGSYLPGEIVPITADTCRDGFRFKEWQVVEGPGGIVDDSSGSDTTVTMPAQDATVRAVCERIPLYRLIVINGTGGGRFPAGAKTPITADDRSPGEVFVKWVVNEGNPRINRPGRPETDLTMPAEDVTVEATYKPNLFRLTVENGSGSGSYPPGENVPITADTCPRNFRFKEWQIIAGPGGIVDDSSGSDTTVTMPAEDATVRAVCEELPKYTLTVENGSGSGTYFAGQVVPISSDTCRSGFTFRGWRIIDGPEGIIDDSSAADTSVTMPAEDATVRAECEAVPEFTLTVINGDGDGEFPAGAVTPITADDPPPGRFNRFVFWEVISGNPSIARPRRSPTDLTMPAEDVTVEAIFWNPCDQTDVDRSDQLMEIFKRVSGEEPFDDPNSPQSKAAEWMINKDDFYVCPGVKDKKIIQRYVMAVFYYSYQGDNWLTCFEGDQECGKDNNDFEGQVAYLSPVNECEWAGNTCDETLCITSIIFEENNNVQGTTAFELGELDILEVISMESQSIGGTLPKELARPRNMRIIDFDFNQLTGPIPQEYFFLPDLEQLDLNNNFMTGSLPPTVGNLQNLIFLQLHVNQFTGTFPPSLADTSVLVAEFQDNNFFGTMPLCIGAPGQTVGAISTDCGPASGAPVTCGAGCGCNCF